MKTSLAILSLVLSAVTAVEAYAIRDSSTTYSCVDSTGFIAHYGRGWSTTSAAYSKVIRPKVRDTSIVVKLNRDTRRDEAEIVRDGYFGAVTDKTYTVDGTLSSYRQDLKDEKGREKAVKVPFKTLVFNCRSFSGDDAEMSYFGPGASGDVSPTIQEFLALPAPQSNAVVDLSSSVTVIPAYDSEKKTARAMFILDADITIRAEDMAKIPFTKDYYGNYILNKGGKITPTSAIQRSDRDYCYTMFSNARDEIKGSVTFPKGTYAIDYPSAVRSEKSGKVFSVSLSAYNVENDRLWFSITCMRDLTIQDLFSTLSFPMRFKQGEVKMDLY